MRFEMKMQMIALALFGVVVFHGEVSSHCQMPCGVYHDDMVFDEVDQYVETMYKGVSVLKNSAFVTLKERQDFIRWVMEKEKESDKVAELITKYFLQQKIKPGEVDTQKKVLAAHNLLFLLVGIKQNCSLEEVEGFSNDWDRFKLMFHREGYECQMEKIKMKKNEGALKSSSEGLKVSGGNSPGHDHQHNDHDHHDHHHDD